MSARDGRRIAGTPSVEQLEQLLAGCIVVEGAILADDGQELVERALTISFRIQSKRKIVRTAKTLFFHTKIHEATEDTKGIWRLAK